MKKLILSLSALLVCSVSLAATSPYFNQNIGIKTHKLEKLHTALKESMARPGINPCQAQAQCFNHELSIVYGGEDIMQNIIPKLTTSA